MAYYKVLDEEGRSCNGGSGTWPLPKGGQPGDWLEVKGKLVPCHNGLHLSRERDLVEWLGPTIWEAEGEGEHVTEDNKIVWRKARLLRKLEGWNERTARLFACDCAERALKAERKAGREPDQRSWDAVTTARRFALGEATEKERSAAWSAADWVARSLAKSVADSAAWSAAESAAWSVADSAAETAAWWAAKFAARSVAWSAAKLAAWSVAEPVSDSAAWSASEAATWTVAWSAAWSAAWLPTREWQTRRLLRYLRGRSVGPVRV